MNLSSFLRGNCILMACNGTQEITFKVHLSGWAGFALSEYLSGFSHVLLVVALVACLCIGKLYKHVPYYLHNAGRKCLCYITIKLHYFQLISIS
jgi:hypothetical protein